MIKGSKVKVLAGKNKNKESEIIEMDKKNHRAKVKGLNMIKKHVKSTKEKKVVYSIWKISFICPI